MYMSSHFKSIYFKSEGQGKVFRTKLKLQMYTGKKQNIFLTDKNVCKHNLFLMQTAFKYSVDYYLLMHILIYYFNFLLNK